MKRSTENSVFQTLPAWAETAIDLAAKATPALSVIDTEAEADAQVVKHQAKISAAECRLRNAWPKLDRFFVFVVSNVGSECKVGPEGICGLILKSALVWFSRLELKPVKRARIAAEQLVKAEWQVVDTALQLQRALEEFVASRQAALDADLSPSDVVWNDDIGSVLVRLGRDNPPWASSSGLKGGALRKVIRAGKEPSINAPDALQIVRSIFFLAPVLRAENFQSAKHQGSDPGGDEALLRLFMQRLERIGHSAGYLTTPGPLDWLGPDRLAVLLQTVYGCDTRPSRSSIRNARKSVLAARSSSLPNQAGEV